MSFKKISLMAVLALCSLGTLAACNGGTETDGSGSNSGTGSNSGDGASHTGTIILAGPTEANNFTLEHAQAWNEANGYNYTFEFQVHGEDKITTEVNDFSASTAPDIFMYANDGQPGLLQKKVISPVPDSNVEAMSDEGIAQAFLDSVTFDDTVYGYPYTSNSYCFWYNKDKAEQYVAAPETYLPADMQTRTNYTDWTMLEWCKVAAKNGLKIAYDINNGFYNAPLLCSYDGAAQWKCDYDRNGILQKVVCQTADDNGLKVAKNMIRWVATGGITEELSVAPSNNSPILANITGAWSLTTTTGAPSDFANDEVQCMALPDLDDGNGGDRKPMYAFTGSKAMGVNALKSSDPVRVTDVHSLALYLVSPEVQTARYDFNESWLPSSNQATAEGSKCIDALNQVMEHAIAQANLPQSLWDATGALGNLFFNADGGATLTPNSSDEEIMAALRSFDTQMQTVNS